MIMIALIAQRINMDQRFSQATDRLFHKGYSLYPYSEENHIQSERFCSLIRGTHKRTEHEKKYLIAVPHRDFGEEQLQVLRNLNNRYLQLFDIELGYVTYLDIPQLNSKYIDKIVGDCIVSGGKQTLHKTHQKNFTSKSNCITQSTPVQGASCVFNMTRLRKITDKIASKGYSLYPFSQQREIEIGRQVAVILASHEKIRHQGRFLVAIPHHDLEGLVLQSIKNVCFKDSIKRLYDLDQDYLIFYANTLLTVVMIDEMLEQFRNFLHVPSKEPRPSPQPIPLRQSAPISVKENSLPANHIAYPMSKTMQKNPDGTKPQQVPTSMTKRFNASSLCRNLADVGKLQGQTIDGYKVRKKLGEGGFGFVYLVEKAGNYSVMKIAKSSQGSRSIIDETESIIQFNNLLEQADYRDFPKCVPSLYCSGKFQGLPYFVEEFILTLNTLKNIIYKSNRVLKFSANTSIANYYNDKASEATCINEQEKYLDLASAVERMLQKQRRAIPIDPLVAAHISLQLMFLIYVMNANNYHYGDLKSENVGIRLEDMNIIRKDHLESSSKFEFALKDNVIARQLEIGTDSFPSFCAVLLDFGSLSRYKRQDNSTIFFTPKYMVPNELTLRQGKVKKSFVKDPYTLGLVLLEMVSGLEPFWHVRLSGDTDQQVGTIDAMYDAGEKAFDLKLVKLLLDLNVSDIHCQQESEIRLTELIIENANMLIKGVFKEEIVSIIAHLRKNLMKYSHQTPSRYQALKRYSEHDELRL